MCNLRSTALAIATLLFALARPGNGDTVAATISSDVYFYGQSPPVYPAPVASGTGDWGAAYQQAQALVSRMTLEEKVNLTAGTGDTTTGCPGAIGAIQHLGFPGLCLADAGQGVRSTDLVSGYPSGVHVGASWNKDLTRQRGQYLATEFRLKGVNIALGPAIGPLGRIATGGRNWEGFSNDPYLTGQLAAETVRAMQEVGVITSTKHLIANEQETNRIPRSNSNNETVDAVSSNIDDKTLHGLYLWPFVDALRAGTGCIMCSYNRINNSYACQNSKLLNGILKEELGFQGFVLSDWDAQHSGVGSVLAGLDMTMPIPKEFWGANLIQAVRNSSVPERRVNDMATRIIATWYHLNQNKDYPGRGVGMPVDIMAPHKQVNARTTASKSTLLKGAVEGHVLVKNIKNALPLNLPTHLSIFGYDAKAPDIMSPSGQPFNPWALGYTVSDFRAAIPHLLGFPDPQPVSQIALGGTLLSGAGSGGITPPYWDAPFNALQQRARQDGTVLFWDFITADSTAPVYSETDACLVFINAFAGEGYDRAGLHDDFSDALVLNIANKCANTIVVIHNAGVRLVDQFESHPNVTAIIFAHLPGQDSGSALVSLLYGDENFSGKLPYTVAKNESQYGEVGSPTLPESRFALYPQSNFSEGVYIDYRAFDKSEIAPRYEFGFGLSYTTFGYSDLTIEKSNPANKGQYPRGRIEQGGRVDLWDRIAIIRASVRNTGNVKGQEVLQLYVGIPNGPIRQLRGFSKENLKPGESKSVQFPLTRRDLSVWDVAAQNWRLQTGEYQIYVGSSSRKLPLQGKLVI
ncbi:putative beta-glucosidase [Cadophora sp. MPI-SDFR-AT-0126]|nr:putative beta-glucosidase [Leotiomycetes sp. MPI-SDFR-AT-0126]